MTSGVKTDCLVSQNDITRFSAYRTSIELAILDDSDEQTEILSIHQVALSAASCLASLS